MMEGREEREVLGVIKYEEYESSAFIQAPLNGWNDILVLLYL